jgi:cyanate lyase
VPECRRPRNLFFNVRRGHEVASVYGTTIKELIHEEFGDGIMSAIDFSMDITREPDPDPDPDPRATA